MNKWLVDSVFGKAGEIFYMAQIKKPVIFMDNGFRVFNINDMQWYYFYEGRDYERE
jgi:hypothetical protein